MSDDELLVLAAKAAGIGPLDFDYAKREGHGFYVGPRLPMPNGVLMAAMYTYWRPLEDDGDALRLAVKLGLAITPYPIYSKPKHSVVVKQFDHARYLRGEGEDVRCEEIEVHNDDALAATRRAIVRAAAAIGEAMP